MAKAVKGIVLTVLLVGSGFLVYAQDTVESHLSMGDIYRDVEEYDQALAEYKKVVEIDPDYAPAYSRMAFIYEAQEKYEEAIVILKKYEQLVADTEKEKEARARLHIAKSRKLLKENPQSAEAHNELGLAYREKGSNEAAIEEFRKAIRINQGFEAAYVNLALLYEKKEMYGEAISQWMKLKELNPVHPLISEHLQIIKSKQPKAYGLRKFRKLKEGTDAEVLFRKASRYYKDEAAYKKAIDLFEKVIRDFPDTLRASDAQYQIGYIYLNELKEYRKAIKAFKDLIKDYSNSNSPWVPEAQYQIGSSYQKWGESLLSAEQEKKRADTIGEKLDQEAKYRRALKEYQRTIDEYPLTGWDVNAHFGIAGIYRALEKTRDAVKEYREIIEKYSSAQLVIVGIVQHNVGVYVRDARFGIGEVYTAAQNYRKAEKQYKEIVKIYPGSTAGRANDAIAANYEKQEDMYKTRKHYKAAVDEYEKSGGCADLLRIGDIYSQKLGKKREAREYYKKVVEAGVANPDCWREVNGAEARLAQL